MATQTQANSPLIEGPALGDPIGCRETIRRYYEGSCGVRQLADGREVHATWLAASHTHVHIVVWECGLNDGPGPAPLAFIPNVVRVQAARVMEKLLVELES